MNTPLETAAIAPTVKAGEFAGLNAANTVTSVNTCATGLARGAAGAAEAGIGSLLQVGAAFLPIAGIMAGTYFGLDMITNGALSGKKRY